MPGPYIQSQWTANELFAHKKNAGEEARLRSELASLDRSFVVVSDVIKHEMVEVKGQLKSVRTSTGHSTEVTPPTPFQRRLRRSQTFTDFRSGTDISTSGGSLSLDHPEGSRSDVQNADFPDFPNIRNDDFVESSNVHESNYQVGSSLDTSKSCSVRQEPYLRGNISVEEKHEFDFLNKADDIAVAKSNIPEGAVFPNEEIASVRRENLRLLKGQGHFTNWTEYPSRPSSDADNTEFVSDQDVNNEHGDEHLIDRVAFAAALRKVPSAKRRSITFVSGDILDHRNIMDKTSLYNKKSSISINHDAGAASKDSKIVNNDLPIADEIKPPNKNFKRGLQTGGYKMADIRSRCHTCTRRYHGLGEMPTSGYSLKSRKSQLLPLRARQTVVFNPSLNLVRRPTTLAGQPLTAVPTSGTQDSLCSSATCRDMQTRGRSSMNYAIDRQSISQQKYGYR